MSLTLFGNLLWQSPWPQGARDAESEHTACWLGDRHIICLWAPFILSQRRVTTSTPQCRADRGRRAVSTGEKWKSHMPIKSEKVSVKVNHRSYSKGGKEWGLLIIFFGGTR